MAQTIFVSDIGVLGAKVETTEGTAIAVASGDTFRAYEVVATPAIEMQERKPLAQDHYPHADIPGKRSATIVFKTEFKGGGTAGVAPEFGELFKMCKYTETIEATAFVTYTPAASGGDSGTLQFDINSDASTGKRYTFTGCRGTFTLEWVNGEIAFITWTFTAAEWTEADSAPLSGLAHETTTPLIFQGATVEHDTDTPCTASLNFDTGGEVVLRDCVGQASGNLSAVIVDFNPTGSFDHEERTIAAGIDVMADWKAGTARPVSAKFGSVAGDIGYIYVQNAQLKEVAPGDRNKIRIQNDNFKPLRSGDTGSIASAIDGGGGLVTMTTSTAHGLRNGAVVTLSGTTTYDGAYIIQGVTSTTFNIVATFVATTTGTWVIDGGFVQITFA